MSQPVYIQRIAGFLPGQPIANDEMEAVLGQVGERPSRARRVVLRNNGIRHRHYAIDPATGAATHNNAQLTAEAVRRLGGPGFELNDIDLLACGTSTPDQIMPGHASMVHGALGNPPCEFASLSGVCISGVGSLRYAALAVAAGVTETAVATGSELFSSFMRAGMFDDEADHLVDALGTHPEKAFHRDFLRWMLSDGAGAMLLRASPAASGLCLRLNWIEQRSFANKLPVCMYAGAENLADGCLKGWREYASPEAAARAGAFSLKQDVRLLNDHITQVSFGEGLAAVRACRTFSADEIDWFVPHYSSEYFRPRLAALMRQIGFEIPAARWVTNLADTGNVGAASIYFLLEKLAASDDIAPGQNILCFVPESGRFSSAFLHLTVVDREGAPGPQ
ncbi:MAG: beta-ketoacyl-ACP synthase III [Salinisphaera sp.]|nr:beta-ketoacyl-ACP synthase III [Salinisphaera sp.]